MMGRTTLSFSCLQQCASVAPSAHPPPPPVPFFLILLVALQPSLCFPLRLPVSVLNTRLLLCISLLTIQILGKWSCFPSSATTCNGGTFDIFPRQKLPVVRFQMFCLSPNATYSFTLKKKKHTHRTLHFLSKQIIFFVKVFLLL